MSLAQKFLRELTLDPRCQVRVQLYEDHVAQMVEYLQTKDERGKFYQLPPIIAFRTGRRGPLWVADGWHRFRAHELAGRKTICVDIREGTLRDAVLFAVGANARHGRRLEEKEVRQAVLILLEDEEWGLWSAREIARRVGCGRNTVSRLRDALSGTMDQIEGNGEVKARRKGTTYTMKFRDMPSEQQRAEVEAVTASFCSLWRRTAREGLEQAEYNLAAEGEAVATVLPHVRAALKELRRIEKAERGDDED